MDEEKKRSTAPLGLGGTKSKEEEDTLKKKVEETEAPYHRFRLYALLGFLAFVLFFVFLCLSAGLGWPMPLTVIFLLLDFICLCGDAFLWAWMEKRFDAPYREAKRNLEEFEGENAGK